MKIVKLILLVLLVLMSLAAGAAKIMQAPQEVAFFNTVGVTLGLLIPFGALQIISAILASIPKTRKSGLIAMALVFLASAVMIFAGGNIGFGLISLVPAALAAGLAVMMTPNPQS